MGFTNLFTNGQSNFGKIEVPKINSFQLNALEEIERSYSSLLAEKQYESVQTNLSKYIDLLSILDMINIPDPKIMLLINIVKDTLTGSINTISLYRHFTYNKKTILILNKQIDDILSNKNVVKVLNDTNGLISVSKNLMLTPLLSNYVSKYGMPAYGDGFDPIKLSNLKKSLALI